MATKKKALAAAATLPPVTSIKGFASDLTCRGFQFEVGKTYNVSGKIKACGNGFHACPTDQHPLSVFEFYPPAGSRFFEVTQGGDRDAEATKLASASITLGVEISLGDLAARTVKWVFDRANWKDGEVATKDNEGVTASGYSGAATASGSSGAATASGDRGAATASGYSGAATASGKYGRARGADGCAIFLLHRDDDWNITHAWAGVVGQNGIKAETWYSLDQDGVPIPCEVAS